MALASITSWTWLRPGDSLISCYSKLNQASGLFCPPRDGNWCNTGIRIGPPILPIQPGAYFAIGICIDACSSRNAEYSSRAISR